MVSFTSVVTAVVALAGQALAANPVQARQATGNTCTVGHVYCGFNLLNNGGTIHDEWLARINQALIIAGQPTDVDHENHSLFECDGPQQITFTQFCKVGSQRCQNANANACTSNGQFPPNNDCCGAFS